MSKRIQQIHSGTPARIASVQKQLEGRGYKLTHRLEWADGKVSIAMEKIVDTIPESV